MDFGSVFNYWELDRDFGLGVWIFGFFKMFVDILSLLVLFYFSLKDLHFNETNFAFFRRIVNRLCLRSFDSNTNTKMSSCKCGLKNFLNTSNPPMIEKWEVVKETINCKEDNLFDDDKQEKCDEDEVVDLLTLRRLIKMERKRANDAYVELEKERMSSTTASEEAMAMVLRLQNQKSVLEMEARQLKRLAHEKQLHDQEVIQSLRWIVMKHESERSILEDRLRLCKQRLTFCMNDEGDDGRERVHRSISCLDGLDEGLVSSLDLGLSPW
ncbi:uncharacterized protein [Rutidosis leptorrhynchoides]|uniref:uncharacterized protein n=1 Tax=Rutidosis leptorrhynchoides TaxID=125765 RepID=UPI003A998329